MTNNFLKVVVIGGGAAGFFGAIAIKENANSQAHTSVQVTLLEAAHKPLAKVRISGGGRCNVTHHCFDPAQLVQYYPRGGKALRGAFIRFQPQDTISWFNSRGVKLKTEADGRMFPITDDSSTIIDCLMTAAKKAGVRLRIKAVVKNITSLSPSPSNNKQSSSLISPRRAVGEVQQGEWERSFQIELKNGETLFCDRLLIATGSNPLGYRWAKSLGHTIAPPVPSLFTFNIKDVRLQNLAGVSVENIHIRLLGTGKEKLKQTGALLITHWGVSGPAILKLSAWGARVLYDNNYHLSLEINWLPQYNQETLRQFLIKVKSENKRKQIYSYCPLQLPKRLWQSLLKFVGIFQQKIWIELSKKELDNLVQELIKGQYKITGKGIFKEEFVTCGGVNLKEINFKSMESKICPGVYFAGEILDIDGVTGGFNFQSAWTTGWLAGKAIGSLS